MLLENGLFNLRHYNISSEVFANVIMIRKGGSKVL